MAVPASCSQWVSAKLNTLLFMTMVRISNVMAVGKLHLLRKEERYQE